MTDLHLSTGAAALHALDAGENQDFIEHLEHCPTCRAEADSFGEALARLGAGDELAPPAALKATVLDQARRTPQLPPLTGAPALSQASVPMTAAPAAGSAVAESHRRWFARPTAWLAAAAVVAAATVGTVVVLGQDTAPPTAGECVAGATDVRRIAPNVGAGGDVEHSSSCGAVVIHVPSMPALPPGQVYQVWVMAGDEARSMGVVTPDGGVMDTPVVTGDTDIGVSIEPAPAGSDAPTSAPIWVVPL